MLCYDIKDYRLLFPPRPLPPPERPRPPAPPRLPLSPRGIIAVAPLPLLAYLTAFRTLSTSEPPPPSLSLRARLAEDVVEIGFRSSFETSASAADFSASMLPSLGSNWDKLASSTSAVDQLTFRLMPRSFGSPSSFLSNLG